KGGGLYEGRRQKAEGRRQKAEGRNPAVTRGSCPTAGFLPSAFCLLLFLRLRVQPISLPHALRLHALAELLAQARLEAFHPRLVGAGEDADELAAAVVADDVLLAAKRRERLVELRVLLVRLDPVNRERLIEL